MYVLAKGNAHLPPINEPVRDVIKFMLSSRINSFPNTELCVSQKDPLCEGLYIWCIIAPSKGCFRTTGIDI